MDLINKSKLKYIDVYTDENKTKKVKAVLKSSIEEMPTYSFTKHLDKDTEIPIEYEKHIDEESAYKYSDTDMMIILEDIIHIIGLSRVEKEVLEMAYSKLEQIINCED